MAASPSTGSQLRGETQDLAPGPEQEDFAIVHLKKQTRGVPKGPHTHSLVSSPIGSPVVGAGFIELIWGLVCWSHFEMTGDIDLK